MRRNPALVAALLAAVVVLLGCAGCASPGYRFVGSEDRDLVLRVPRDWNVVKTADVLKASGVDPASRPGWLAFYDASSRPSPTHLRGTSATAPVMAVQSLPISAEERAGLTDDGLRNLVLPVTTTAREAIGMTATPGPGQPEFHLISDQVLNSKSEHGVHVLFSYTIKGATEVYDQVVVTDPKKTTAHLVLVHCVQSCFAQRADEIDGVTSSVTVKPR